MITVLYSTARAERWVLTTLEWPPYVCSRCPENGAAANALRSTLKSVGVDVEFVFYSWTQAIKKGRDPGVVGYFPPWIDEVAEGFVMSPPLFQSPLGFIENRDHPLKWSHLADLKGKKIGVTESYGNTVEFARLVKAGVLKTEVAKSDDINVRKVALGKLDAALMDINNARYFIYVSEPQLVGRVNINSKIIETKDLYLALNNKNAAKMEKVKTALKNVNFQRLVDDYLLKFHQ